MGTPICQQSSLGSQQLGPALTAGDLWKRLLVPHQWAAHGVRTAVLPHPPSRKACHHFARGRP